MTWWWVDIVNERPLDAVALRRSAAARGIPTGRPGPSDGAALAAAPLLLDGLDALAAALLAGRSPEAAVRRLDALLGLGGGRFRAATGGAAFEPAAGPLMGVVVAVARDALTFTGGSAAARIRRCPRAGPPCGRLFVDASPAGTREYCSPTCAAVERARRHRARMRA